MDFQELAEVLSVLEEMKVPYYIHAGIALSLHGMDGELDDCDIWIFHHDIRQFYKTFKDYFPGKVRLRSPVAYSRGIYNNYCVLFSGDMKIDICAEMVADCDIGMFEFPLDESAFKDADFFDCGSLNLPVASIENLFLYYLVLRRTKYHDEKKDEFHVKEMLGSGKFDEKNS
ncbi:MAG: hypothetical protein J7K00_02325 [Candidatus Diapherotrites archaeon]|nr:hypothetical protein [Candidatus Diapherotrites archaeon]